ncbi:DEAD/DEAH box helicase [Pontivivens insulae]|uniref:DNA 3'-5' helicase II n=1 Tax=Pontivivens insulae TaxID=1639689 RepID=A0A2R8A9S5_9RHOB|nr:ATP-binding domain-containing protein [Pontivivens insulae]RED12895.1 superfamily I DNA and RNA helicase [Pontivivens insulae]SPF28987.1 hypothetical protein POI8812_01292 [Pontivivens insulae]
MPLEFIPVRSDYEAHPHIDHVIRLLRDSADELGADGGVLYYGWPQISDYDATVHQVDLALVSSTCGLVLIRCLANPDLENLARADASISQAAASSESQLLKSGLLRKRRKLVFDVIPILYSPGCDPNGDMEAEVASTEEALLDGIEAVSVHQLSVDEVAEVRSILEGAKALGRPNRRKIEDPEQQALGVALSKLEEEIASFDSSQRNVALTNLNCPQRIRGLAGSGKTVILAMKAAMAHIENPDAQILFTYFTRSLRDTVIRMITRFYRHFAEGEPNWDRIDVRHGWGRRDTPGVYRDLSMRLGRTPLSFMDAKGRADPFDYVCKELMGSASIQEYYDLILIDEGQDFPDGFYQMCFHLAKGPRDNKQIVWAYDELQNIFNVEVRSPETLFGSDTDGEPNISLARSLPEYAETNDFVLQKCYRNQKNVLVLAHAIGFGLYGQPVQMLQNKEHWEDVGYDVISGGFATDDEIIVERPGRNSPTSLEHVNGFDLIKYDAYANLSEEVAACAQKVDAFVKAGLEPHDIMVIAIDDRSARQYLNELSATLATLGYQSNNIIADKYNEPPFLIEGKVTMSTVHRAKGNEAAVVIVLGCDAVNLISRTGRNRLFTAFTRSKAWLCISGYESSSSYQRLMGEVGTALANCPRMVFTMPDVDQIELIQRDLRDKDSKLLEAKIQIDKVKDELGLTDDDLFSVIDRD